eukprot:Hpha_TRINITY_DN17007_c4_g3::TRINITY_DN17007_c4_g3_i1::g.166503::m.166503/K00850/pfkA, PFK; 6-phosphofructokinase 1
MAAAEKMDRAKYLAQSRLAEVCDRLVGDVLAAQPSDLPEYLRARAGVIAAEVLGLPPEKVKATSTSVTGATTTDKVGRVTPEPPEVGDLEQHHLSTWSPGHKRGPFEEGTVNAFDNPMQAQWPGTRFHRPEEAVLGNVLTKGTISRAGLAGGGISGGFVRAGATQKVWWNPRAVRAGIVTCGGLCPGLNSIIREVTRCLRHCYGVESVLGFRSGYAGILKPSEHPPTVLTTDNCREIHLKGGSVLEAGRGGFNPDGILDTLRSHGINMLFVVGGDGSQWAADVLVQAAHERSMELSVVGIPKSIDNDVCFFDRTFGFETAVQTGCDVIRRGHVEASSCHHGVAIVKLMGRDAGFVARNAALASTLADLVLIPEVDWKVDDLLAHVVNTLTRKNHMIIVVAEGAGQKHVSTGKQDDTGHTVYGDIGAFLRDTINKHLKSTIGGRCFYIDPSYIIRSGPADPNDHMYCARMAYDSVHAAMRGYTGVCVGSVHGFMCMVPMECIAGAGRKVMVSSSVWQACVQSAKMPACLSGMDDPGNTSPRSPKSGVHRKKKRGNPAMYRTGGELAGKNT